MKTVNILEDHDHIDPHDYMRPLTLLPISPSSGIIDVESYSEFSSTPMNNIRWIKVKDYFGKCHWGKTVQQIHKEFSEMYYSYNINMKFEFIRGDIPSENVWTQSSP
ncbi:hypothetical protein PBI_SCTP2_409 [Salicola phage SCTP-2]|nr:hypothetical protein PBI_SCTP2_409 [Salicola phage SCTP-2]